MKREEIVKEAEKWLEVRWKHQGRTKHGLDCAGLIIKVGNSLGATNYDTTDYARTTYKDAFVSKFVEAGFIKKPLQNRKIGDIVLFRDGVFACHCGFIARLHGVESLIHAYAVRRKCVHEILLPDLLQKMTYCFYLPGVED